MDKETIPQLFRKLDSGDVVELATLVLIAVMLVIVIQRLIPWLGNRLLGKSRLTVIASIPFIRLAIILTTFAALVPRIIEPSLQNMVALFGTVGLALGFALKDYASSLIAGVVALGETSYRNGDWVKVGDVYGEIRHIGMRTIEVVTPEDDRVLIPHSSLWNQPIINANNGEPRLQCSVNFYLDPAHDCGAVRRALEDVALTSSYLYFDSPVMVRVEEKPWGTRYVLKAYPTDSMQQFRFTSDLTVRGKAVLAGMNVNYARFSHADGQV